MPPKSTKPAPRPTEKTALHPRNRHRARYNFRQLMKSSPELADFVRPNKFGDESVDFANPAAVKALNRALLRHDYGLDYWDIPAGYLCPPIPGRADYVHYLADLLAADRGGTVPRGAAVRVLDIGVGANCIYPIIGTREYGWHFVGSEIDPVALRAARQIVGANPALAGAVELRLQHKPEALLEGILQPGEVFDVVLCNPPFHASAAEAAASNDRKRHNLRVRTGARPALNFGGQTTELWCKGGEETFVRQLVKESARHPSSAGWFTALISKQTTVPGILKELGWAEAAEVQTIDMTQGQKTSRFVAWSFLTAAQRAALASTGPDRA